MVTTLEKVMVGVVLVLIAVMVTSCNIAIKSFKDADLREQAKFDACMSQNHTEGMSVKSQLETVSLCEKIKTY